MSRLDQLFHSPYAGSGLSAPTYAWC